MRLRDTLNNQDFSNKAMTVLRYQRGRGPEVSVRHCKWRMKLASNGRSNLGSVNPGALKGW